MARGIASDFLSEADLQKACVREARAAGWLARRYSGTGRRSYPDYFFARRGACVWVEFKRLGNQPTELQRLEHDEMRRYGLRVEVIDSRDGFKALLASYEGPAWLD